MMTFVIDGGDREWWKILKMEYENNESYAFIVLTSQIKSP